MIWEDAIVHIYPDIKPNQDFFIRYDGENFSIEGWKYTKAKPTKDELDQAWLEISTVTIQTPKTDIELLREQTADTNLQIIDIWETLINGGVA